ncbi:MAG: 2-C-methyl-D-erythritol 4-phosphate cytidylyltransferase [Nocardioidaceae bacterium]|nr:2-C-methyl-D-erythritol 4-phosphate cytidylyltransferase [Nocardioidaceae bacterium]
MTSRRAALVPAAGLGVRLDGHRAVDPAVPKAFRQLAGRSLVRRCVELLVGLCDEVVVAVPNTHLDLTRADLQGLGRAVQVVIGGADRQASVARALAAAHPEAETIVVHDAARPLVPPDVVRRVLDALDAGAQAVVPTQPVADSLRVLGANGLSAPIDRSSARAVQTPQGFRRTVLEQAHAAGLDVSATDDASLVERLGVPVTLVEGDPLAFKITRPLDLLLAEAVLAAQR